MKPHRWHVRGGIVGWGYRYPLGPGSSYSESRDCSSGVGGGGRDLGDGGA